MSERGQGMKTILKFNQKKLFLSISAAAPKVNGENRRRSGGTILLDLCKIPWNGRTAEKQGFFSAEREVSDCNGRVKLLS